MIVPRRLEPILRAKLAATPAVVLLGPRQVGKTTLARRIASDWPGGARYLDMERPADQRRLEDADAYLRAEPAGLVVLDEIHRVPNVFGLLRGVIDEQRAGAPKPRRYLLLGSATLDLMRQASETLAGRVAYLELSPLDVSEIGAANLGERELWVRGGFPPSLLAASDAASLEWRQDFIRSYLEREVPMFAPRLPAETVGRLWSMLAHQQGALLNHARLAASLGVSAPAVGRYLDLLVDLKLVRRLQPWSANPGKRLVKAPKVYIRDSGIVHALLDLETWDDVLGHPVAGASYEGMAIENLIEAAGARYRPFFYRSRDGAEIDLILERAGRPEVAVEVKRSSAPGPGRGFALACERLGVARRHVVYPGTESFPLRHGAVAIGLRELVGELSGQRIGRAPL